MEILEEAHRASVFNTIDEIAGKLQTVLGQRLTAYAVGVKDPKAIGKYARGENEPREDTVQRLRDLYRIVTILGHEQPDVVRAWMIGSNPYLDDRAPIELLHEENIKPVARTADFSPVPFTPEAFQRVYRASADFVKAKPPTTSRGGSQAA
jgi:hypothetical protein